jgi:hypothetical protein
MAEPIDIEAPLRELEETKRREAELQTQLAAVQGKGNAAPNIDSGGGAVVEGAVRTAGGHFIGRDFIQTVTQVVQRGEDEEEAKSVIAHYLHALAADLAGLKLGEIDAATDRTRQEPLQLADVYVPLNTTLQVLCGWTLADWMQDRGKQAYVENNRDLKTRFISALEAVAHHRELTLLGLPGSGKSTFGAYLLLSLAQAWQGHPDELAKQESTWSHSGLLPIRVVLRRFADQLPAGEAPARAGDLWDFIACDLKAAGHGLSDRVSEYVQRIARTQGAYFLLDGLDECGDAQRRARVKAAVDELMRNAGARCRFVLTARPYAWPGGPDPERGVYALADFGDGQVQRFIGAWYDALVKRGWSMPGEAGAKRDELLAARHRPDLAPLVKNPLLLTLTASLNTHSRLPEDRADLYDRSVDLLMLRWNVRIGADKALLEELAVPDLKLSSLRETLEELAFRAHELHDGREGAADIGEDRLIRAFTPLLNNSRDKAALVVEYIEKRAGLLIGQGEKDRERQFTFPHRTFQEFLAACHLAAREDFAAECARLARSAPEHWQVVLPLAARVAKVERGASAADELVGGVAVEEFHRERQPNQADWTSALLAARQLAEIGLGALQPRPRTRAITARVAGWLAAGLPVHPKDGGLPAKRRAEAGDLLAQLGDPRFHGPERCHLPAEDDLGFMRILADPNFHIGTRRADATRVAKILGSEVPEYELNDEPTPTPEFWIGRYPVTAAQFRAYLAAEGLERDDDLSDPDTRPVCRVSWHEALGYCAWLERMLRESPILAETAPARVVWGGGRVTLPSELEWEKAARGGRVAAVCPWGDAPDPERANTGEAGFGDTTAVGGFPANDYGLFDTVGNVWEWTRSLWGLGYPYRAGEVGRETWRTDNEKTMVVRGGSWGNHQVSARCAYRGRDLSEGRGNDLGFRVVLLPAPAPSLGFQGGSEL